MFMVEKVTAKNIYFTANSDLLACTVITRDSVKTRRFLVIDIFQFILVEPSQKRMGWGVVKFVGFLQVSKETTSIFFSFMPNQPSL